MSDSGRVPRASPAEAGDRQTLREQLDEHRGDLRRFAVSRLGNGHEADEIAQQTLFQALQKLSSFRGGDLRAWLLAIARRLIVDRRREQGRYDFVTIDEDFIAGEGAVLRTPYDRVPAVCDARERIRRCLQCIGTRLPLRQQVAVLLAEMHGFGNTDSAVRMGMTESSYRSLLQKARRRLHTAAGCECSLVAKAGAEHACSGGPRHGGGARLDAGHGSPRTGLGDEALAALRRELVEPLGVGEFRAKAEGA